MVYFLNPPRALEMFLSSWIIVLVPDSYADAYILNETGSLGYWNLWNFRYWQELYLKQRSRQTAVQAKQIISLCVMLSASCCLGPRWRGAAAVEAGRHVFGFRLGRLLILHYLSSLGLKSVFWNLCLTVCCCLPFLPILLWQWSEEDDNVRAPSYVWYAQLMAVLVHVFLCQMCWLLFWVMETNGKLSNPKEVFGRRGILTSMLQDWQVLPTEGLWWVYLSLEFCSRFADFGEHIKN